MSVSFSKQLLRIAIAQIVKDAGYEHTTTQCTALLVEIAERYLHLLLCSCQSLAEHDGRTLVQTQDLLYTLLDISNDPMDLKSFWFKWGIRIPAPKKDPKANKSTAGNAILDSILGIKRPAPSDAEPVQEISGFFRMAPGTFPLNIDEMKETEYTPPTTQEVPDRDAAVDENEDAEEMENPYLKAKPFVESSYFQGQVQLFVEPQNNDTQPSKLMRERLMSKSRKLFEKAFQSCFDPVNQAPSDPGNMVLSLQNIERLMTVRLRFNAAIPEVTMHGSHAGVLEDFYTTSLPDITPGIRRDMPIFKEDKRDIRKEQKALEAARAEMMSSAGPSTHLEPIASSMGSNLDMNIASSSHPIQEIQSSDMDMSMQIMKTLQMAQMEQSNGIKPPSTEMAAQPKLKLKIGSSVMRDSPLKNEVAVRQQSPPPSSELEFEVRDEQIRCICSNPFMDYGLFMIACDECGIWFHGDCVQMNETTVVDQWFCYKCGNEDEDEFN